MNKLIIMMLLFISYGHAETTEVKIPGKNWGISFDIPTLSQYQAQVNENSFQYIASSRGLAGASNTVLSLFLESDSSGSNKECFESYWSKSKRNPAIDSSSIKLSTQKSYEQVIYKYLSGQPNANFYFINNGHCIDIHVSLSKEDKDSYETLISIGKSLSVYSQALN